MEIRIDIIDSSDQSPRGEAAKIEGDSDKITIRWGFFDRYITLSRADLAKACKMLKED
jgi:hypothetical protein